MRFERSGFTCLALKRGQNRHNTALVHCLALLCALPDTALQRALADAGCTPCLMHMRDVVRIFNHMPCLRDWVQLPVELSLL